MKEYTRDKTYHSFKHVHVYRRQEQAIQRHEMSGISWVCKKDKILHYLTFLHFSIQYLEHGQVIRTHVG